MGRTFFWAGCPKNGPAFAKATVGQAGAGIPSYDEMHTDFRETISLRALREAPGHAEGKTKEIYAHAAKIGNDKGVRSPLDAMEAAV